MGCICMTALDLVLTLKLSGFLLRGLALVSVLKQVRDRVVSYPSSSSSPRCIFKTTCISVLRMAMGCDLDSKKKTKNIRCEIYSPQAGHMPRAFLVKYERTIMIHHKVSLALSLSMVCIIQITQNAWKTDQFYI